MSDIIVRLTYTALLVFGAIALTVSIAVCLKWWTITHPRMEWLNVVPELLACAIGFVIGTCIFHLWS